MLATKLAVRSEESVGTDKKGPGGALGRIFSLAHVSRLALEHATVCQHEVKNASHISESLHREDPVSLGTVLPSMEQWQTFSQSTELDTTL